jgi:hypothetical protein
VLESVGDVVRVAEVKVLGEIHFTEDRDVAAQNSISKSANANTCGPESEANSCVPGFRCVPLELCDLLRDGDQDRVRDGVDIVASNDRHGLPASDEGYIEAFQESYEAC